MLKVLFVAMIIFGAVLLNYGQSAETALNLFKQGNFAESEKVCDQILKKDAKNYDIILLKGRLLLFSNKLKDAEKWLNKAIKLKSDSKEAKAALAETFYRRNEFGKTAPLLREIGREAIAKKLESFNGQNPYQIEGKSDFTSLKFVQTDPLPLIKVKINEGEEIYFLIDTGGAEVIVDSEFATKNNITSFGSEQGTFGGGRQAAVNQGRINSITLGDFKIKNVPVNILDTKRFSAVAGGKKVDGILGTVLLSRFLSTLDYPNGELVLRRTSSKQIVQSQAVTVPFWMAGDHYLVAWGAVNQVATLHFVDTGLAGLGFTAPESTIKEANIKVQTANATEGLGGGGRMPVTPFVVDEISLGAVKQKNIAGLSGAFPPTLENSLGFRIGGLLSHSFFRNYALTLDFQKMNLVLQPK